MTTALSPEVAAILSRKFGRPLPGTTPEVGARVSLGSDVLGTVRTVHRGACACSPVDRAHGLEGFVELDGGGSRWVVFARDVLAWLVDGRAVAA